MGNDFYVYVLFRPWDSEPCYVGKGRKRRWNAHRQYGAEHKNLRLAAVFEKAEKLGQEVRRIKICSNLSEHQALIAEAKLIAFVGRLDTGTGTLANETDGGGGLSGKVWTAEQRNRKRLHMKALWSDPKKRAKQIERIRVAAKRPETIKNRKEATIVRCSTPEFRRVVSTRMKKLWADPLRRVNRTAAITKALSNPVTRAKLAASANRIDCSARALKIWSSASSKKKLMTFNRSAKTRLLRSQKAKERWADPVFKARTAAAMRAAHKRNRRDRKKLLAT